MSERRPYTVPVERIDVARRHTLGYARQIALAAGDSGIPFRIACALIEQESGGRNIYGRNDAPGAALSGFPHEVNEGNYQVFCWLVLDRGGLSNGVGPAQITWRGYHLDAINRGIRLWLPMENLRYAFERILGPHFDNRADWWAAARDYNGSGEKAELYADEVMAKAQIWADRFKEAE
jgi:hypothetical protein